MRTIFLFPLFLAACLTASAQNGRILSQHPVDLKHLKLWENMQYNDTLRERYQHITRTQMSEITYLSDSIEVKGYLYEPVEPGNYPVIIFNRGGNRDFSTLNPLIMIVYTSHLVAEGYIVLASQYREALGTAGKDEFGGAEVNDILHLVETAKQLDQADPERIGLFGWSRGGMMTYLALRKHDGFKTAVVGNGVTDLFKQRQDRPDMEQYVYQECIPDYAEHQDIALRQRSVIYWAEELPRTSSLLLLCGTQDDRVSPEHARRLAARLEELNYNFEFHEFDTDHRFSGKREELKELLLQWFAEHLR